MQELATLNNRLAPYTDNKSQICHEWGSIVTTIWICDLNGKGVSVCVCVCVGRGSGGGGGSQDINHIWDMLVYLHT